MAKQLFMDLKVNESVRIDGGITVTLEKKSGQQARLRFDHDNSDIRRVPDRRAQARDESQGRRSTDVKTQ
jgi:hypothetical protein